MRPTETRLVDTSFGAGLLVPRDIYHAKAAGIWHEERSLLQQQ